MSDIVQGTQAWSNEKLGVITGTRAHELMSSDITRRTLLATLIREIVTADTKSFRATPAMERGTAIEDEAVSYYALMRGVSVHSQTAYIESAVSPMFACSPDGLVDPGGVYEGKRLDEENHIKMTLGADPDKGYVAQCHWNMLITDRRWCDLHFFCETLPDSMRSHVIRIERDDKIARAMEDRALLMLQALRNYLDERGLGGVL